MTQSEYAKAEQVFSQQKDLQVVAAAGDETSLAEAVRSRECRAVIVGVEPYLDELVSRVGRDGRFPWGDHLAVWRRAR